MLKHLVKKKLDKETYNQLKVLLKENNYYREKDIKEKTNQINKLIKREN